MSTTTAGAETWGIYRSSPGVQALAAPPTGRSDELVRLYIPGPEVAE
ncbi:MAG: hypothetical protein ACFB50_01525 [Rubrobacteraceae bacterium]